MVWKDSVVKKQNTFLLIFEYLMLALGSLMMALALNLFLAPNVIAPGGVTGLAVIINKSFKIPIYITNLAINIPLFLLGAKALGKKTASRTLFTTLIFSVILKFIPMSPVTDDLLLAALFGGLITGLGLGIVFRFGGTTGGSDLAGAILNNRFPKFKTSSFMMGIDCVVVVLAGLVEAKAEITLYSVIALYGSVKVMEMILEGPSYSKGFYIITYKPDQVSQALMHTLERGVTALKGVGMYTKKERDVLLCAVNRSEFIKVKELVLDIDPEAFIMVTDMIEVLGEGFSFDSFDEEIEIKNK